MTTQTPSPDTTPRTVGPMTPAKAWTAAAVSALLAFLSSLLTALGGAEKGWDSITLDQWITALIAAIIAFASAGGLTYAVPNRAK